MKKTFEEYFNESKGKPFEYKGKTIQLSFSMEIGNVRKFRLNNFQTNSNWKQGIVIRALNGILKFDHIENSAFVFWQDNFKEYIDFEFKYGEKLVIYNVWDTGNGKMEYGHNGAGIYVKKDNNKITLNCSDGYPNEDFNDLIFTLNITTT